MNFKLNLLAAAALMAASAPALAVMADATSGNGDLLLNVRYYNGSGFSGANDISAVFDLGVTMNDFLANQNTGGFSMNWDLSAANYGSAFSNVLAFVAGQGGSAANIEFSVIALDSTNGTDFVGGHRYLTTSVATTFPALSNSALAALENMNGYVTSNNVRGTHATEVNGASSAVQADGSTANPVYFGSVGGGAGDTWRGKTGDTTQMLGVAQNFWFLTTAAADPLDLTFIDGATAASKTAFGVDLDSDGIISATGALGNEFGTWNVTASGMVSFANPAAPIPEASTYGMMLAGLGLVGFMARRRMNRTA